MRSRVAAQFPAAAIDTVIADFTGGLPAGPFDGVLAANSLHFVGRPDPVLDAIGAALALGGRFILVEYDADQGNPWVPHPISFARWRRLAPTHGFVEPRLLHRVPSRFLNAIYGSMTTKTRVLDSGPSATTEKSSDGSAPERARDGASRAGTTA